MSSPRPHPRKYGERSKSFHGRASPRFQPSSSSLEIDERLRRPETMPNLPSTSQLQVCGGLTLAEDRRPKLTKLLLNVTIQGSPGPVMVLMTPESTVGDLIAMVVKQYVKEARRPVLPTSDPNEFNLHYSQFSLESLDRVTQLQDLGSRNFFLCRRRKATVAVPVTTTAENATATASCSKQAEKVTSKSASRLPRLRFM